jgi:hypothetical protein
MRLVNWRAKRTGPPVMLFRGEDIPSDQKAVRMHIFDVGEQARYLQRQSRIRTSET